MFRLLRLMFVLMVVAAACDNGGFTASNQPASVSIVGKLVAGVSAGAEHVDCAWLGDAEGRRVEIIYPDGWSVLFRPLRVIDDAGRDVAREGDTLRVTGNGGGGGASLCSSMLQRALKVERLP